MNIQGYLDDTVTPPTDTTSTAYYRWYVCNTNYEGYSYETLSWVVGKYPPEVRFYPNPKIFARSDTDGS